MTEASEGRVPPPWPRRPEVSSTCYVADGAHPAFEEEVQRQFQQGNVPGTTHLCNGHEAVRVGVAAAIAGRRRHRDDVPRPRPRAGRGPDPPASPPSSSAAPSASTAAAAAR